MNFYTQLYRFKKPFISTNNKIVFGSVAAFLILLISLGDTKIKDYPLLMAFMTLLLFVPAAIMIVSFFLREEHKKELIGYLEINTKKIVWNGHPIPWQDLIKIKLTLSDIEGSYQPKFSRDFGNTRSSGAKNEIELTLKNSETFIGNFLISSKEDLSKLVTVISGAVDEKEMNQEISDYLNHIIAPINYSLF